MSDFDYLVNKYWEIIKQEVNVKNIKQIPDDLDIKIIYKPIWKNISEKFGKDTWNIISLSKSGNVEVLEEWNVKVFGNGWEWILSAEDYEIAYEWIDETNMAVESWIIIKLDMEITPQLKKEWIVREISRFLNQMRKDADFNVDDRVNMQYFADNWEIKDLVSEFTDFLKAEALLTDVVWASNQAWDISNDFESDLGIIKITLKK